MKKNLLAVKLVLTVGAAILMIYAIIVGNEIILPTAMVVFILLLGAFRSTKAQEVALHRRSKSFHYAVITFAIFFAVLNVFLSLFFPMIAQTLAVDGLYDGEFVRVTINDAHEFCYSICLLLLIEIGFYYGLRLKKSAKLNVLK